MAHQTELGSWADLPKDLHSRIATKSSPDVTEHLSLRLVCKDWACSLTDHPSLPPFLLAPPTAFPNPSVGMALPIQFLNPENAPGVMHSVVYLTNSQYHHWVCVGTSHGWLINLDEHSNVLLLNPVTGDSILLEPLSEIKDILSFTYPGNFYLKREGLVCNQHSIVDLAVLSSDPTMFPNFTLLLFLSGVTDRCFTCRGRDRKWISHQHRPFLSPIEDVVAFNGVFVIFARESNLTIFDFRNDNAGLVLREVNLGGEVPRPTGSVFLVVYDGHLSMVYIHPMPILYYGWFRCTLHFDQFDVDGADNDYVIQWQPNFNFALFLGRGCSVAVSRRHFPWLVAPIYLYFQWKTSSTLVWYYSYICQNTVDFESLSSKILFVDCSHNHLFWMVLKPFWVTPNIRRLDG